jgi:hypothetical protein
MRSKYWRPAIIGLSTLALVILAILIAPAIGQNQAPDENKQIVGREQAEQLSTIATQAIRDGKYKDAIHALRSAAFILEEGTGMHDQGPGGMHQMPGMGGPMPQMMGPGGPMGQGGPQMGQGQYPPDEAFPTKLEVTQKRADELKNAGADLGDIPDRLAKAKEAFDRGSKGDAWDILRAVNADLDRIKSQMQQ